MHVLQDQCIDPRLRRLLDYHQTVALTDRIGAPRVAGGFPVERLNLDVNKRSVGVSDINFIKTVPLTLNATLPVKGELSAVATPQHLGSQLP